MILNTTKSESDSLPGLRKAAMLLVVLGEQTSADLLQHLTEDEVQKVSREVARLTSITAEQAELVLQEFTTSLPPATTWRGEVSITPANCCCAPSTRTTPKSSWTAWPKH